MIKFLLLTLLLPNCLMAAKREKTVVENFNDYHDVGNHYIAYEFMKDAIAAGRKIDKKKAQKVIRNIHPSIIKNDRDLDKLKGKSDLLNYVVGNRLFFLNKWKDAETYLDKVTKSDPMYPERSFLSSVMKYKRKDEQGAIDELKRCYLGAERLDRRFAQDSVYPEAVKNRCLLLLSRIIFEQGDYEQSLYFQNKMPKTEAVWPYLLLDKAWNYYWLKRYPQTLGSLVTYKAPLLKRFMWPEAAYLRALTYYELCYYEKAQKIYEAFNQEMFNIRKGIKKFNGPELRKMILSKREPRGQTKQFVYYLLKGLKKDAKFSLYKLNLQQINKEIKFASKRRKYKKYVVLYAKLLRQRAIMIQDFENYLVFYLKAYYQQILKNKQHFVKLRLDLGIKKRKYFVKSNKMEFEDIFKDLSLSKITETNEKFIWEFKGGFWADELGDYAVANESQCNDKGEENETKK